ncbi:MAG: SOS response-associated peptidase [Alphaproteobacteria bacterium]
MCGKFTQMMSWGAYVSLADFLAGESPSGDTRSELVSPMRDAFVVRLSAGGARETARMRWGLVPWWAKDPGIATRCIHARAETIDTAKAYCDAFRFRRGLIIVSDFFESRHVTPTKRDPHRIWQEDGKPVALACIWERWHQPHDAPLETFAIMTVPANALIAPVHDRMPAIIAESDWPKWLGEAPATAEELKALLKPCEAPMRIAPVRLQKPVPPPPRPPVQPDLF